MHIHTYTEATFKVVAEFNNRACCKIPLLQRNFTKQVILTSTKYFCLSKHGMPLFCPSKHGMPFQVTAVLLTVVCPRNSDIEFLEHLWALKTARTTTKLLFVPKTTRKLLTSGSENSNNNRIIVTTYRNTLVEKEVFLCLWQQQQQHYWGL